MTIKRKKQAGALAWVAATLLSGAAVAQSGSGQSDQSGTSGQSGQTGSSGQGGSASQTGESARSGRSDTGNLGAKPAQRASQRVSDALSVVRRLEAEPRMNNCCNRQKAC